MVVYIWAKSCVDTLQEHFEVFRWVVARSGIVWNKNLRADEANNVVDPVGIALNAPPPKEAVGDGSPKNMNEKPDHNNVVFIFDSSESLSSLWGYIEELLGSGNDADFSLASIGCSCFCFKEKDSDVGVSTELSFSWRKPFLDFQSNTQKEE
ncbi:hypothetical protein Salat_1414600 [Sesamum alatum]|uniref:Uncharacterized protein n=1 Tax=Sesamum alatum TaxID=300844 RepID=A0AAE1YA20_9LAMI|nr:hypothetical protein Salat_1414600 [Sesamum alatum]